MNSIFDITRCIFAKISFTHDVHLNHGIGAGFIKNFLGYELLD